MWVTTMAERTDGNLLLGVGSRSSVNPPPTYVEQLLSNGQTDTNFNAEVEDCVSALAIQWDGKIVVCGWFKWMNGEWRPGLGRFFADGRLDPTFYVKTDGFVTAVLPLPDGRMILGGAFTNMGNWRCNNLVRLLPSGEVDTNFLAGVEGSSPIVHALALRADGRVLVGGWFDRIAGAARANVGCLLPDGSLDNTFKGGVNGTVHVLMPQKNDQVLVGGAFSQVNWNFRNNLARWNPDGSYDTGYKGVANGGEVQTMTLQADGRLIVGGTFSQLSIFQIPYLGCLGADGSVLVNQLPLANGTVYSVMLQTDGNLLVAGDYSRLGTQSIAGLGRIVNDVRPEENLIVDETSVTWLRSGSAPEVTHVQLQASLNGHEWMALGAMTSVAGGWQRTGLNLPIGATVRVQGMVACGYHNRSPWLRVQGVGRPVLPVNFSQQTNLAGTSIELSAEAEAPGPFTYQWLHEGAPLTDGPGVSGAQTRKLVLSQLGAAAAGEYSLVASNAYGSVTGAVTRLVVVDPVIRGHPQSLVAVAGMDATFNVEADGTGSLEYQWYFNGQQLENATNSVLTITNVQAETTGEYEVTVQGLHGAVTSTVSTLTILPPVTVDNTLNLPSINTLNAAVVQPDGKVLLGGMFGHLFGQMRRNIGRLLTNGTPDPAIAFRIDRSVTAFLLRPDRTTMFGGDIYPASSSINQIGLIDSRDGLVPMIPPANGTAYSLLSLPNGGVCVAGDLSKNSDNDYYDVAGVYQLGPDLQYAGPLPLVNVEYGSSLATPVYTQALQEDGQLLVGGSFTNVGSFPARYLARINAAHQLDESFHPAFDEKVKCVAVQADGKILVGGWFSNVSGSSHPYLARLHPDGTVDDDFSPRPNNWVQSMVLQADGKIIIGGYFTNVNGLACGGVARLLANGQVDPSFVFNAKGSVQTLFLETNGNLVAGGNFITVGAQPRTNLARIFNNIPAISGLAFDGDVVRWRRGGSAGEMAYTLCEYTLDGQTWNLVTPGTRVAEGWQFPGVKIRAGAAYRVRGPVRGGYGNGSESYADCQFGSPVCYSEALAVTAYAGTNLTLSMAAYGTMPTGYQWRLNGVDIPGETNATLTITNMPFSAAGRYELMAVNSYGTGTSATCRIDLVQPVVADTFNAGGNSTVLALAHQPDGRLVVGGAFTNLNGEAYLRLGRINADGSLDAGFAPSADNTVLALGVQPDGGLLIGGEFTTVCDQPHKGLARLNADGTLDAGFGAQAEGGPVYSLTPLAGGQWVVAGGFTNLAGQPCRSIGLLDERGNLDTNFQGTANNAIQTVLAQRDGKLVVGGLFTNLGGLPCNYLGRLNRDGTLDTNFQGTADYNVYALTQQADGRILVGGMFTNLNGTSRKRIGRLESDGQLDGGFNPGANERVLAIMVLASGKITVGGWFTTLGGQPRNRLGQLSAGGQVELFYNPGVGGAVQGLAVQSDGRLLVSGLFSTLGGQARANLGRVITVDGASNEFYGDGTSVRWLWRDAALVPWRASFSATTNGTDWFPLGEGEPVAGGWGLAGLNLPTNAWVRGHGYARTGQYNASSSLTEAELVVGGGGWRMIPAGQAFDLGARGFGFELPGPTGQVMVVESSSNLVNWSALLTVTNRADGRAFTDEAEKQTQRYYRLRLP